MSNFVDGAAIVIENEFTVGAVAEGNKFSMLLPDGSYAGFELVDSANNLVQIYDVINGEYIPKAIVSFMPGRDIFCGLFSVGAIPDRNPTDIGCRFFKVTY